MYHSIKCDNMFKHTLKHSKLIEYCNKTVFSKYNEKHKVL